MEELGDFGRSLVPYNPLKPEAENEGPGQLRVMSFNVYADIHCDTPEVQHYDTDNHHFEFLTEDSSLDHILTFMPPCPPVLDLYSFCFAKYRGGTHVDESMGRAV